MSKYGSRGAECCEKIEMTSATIRSCRIECSLYETNELQRNTKMLKTFGHIQGKIVRSTRRFVIHKVNKSAAWR